MPDRRQWKYSILHSRGVSHRCEYSQADGQWPPLRQHNFRTSHYCRGEHRSSVGGSRNAIRVENGAYRLCGIPTGDNGNSLFCTRAPIHIFANFHRRTANGRPYGSTILEHRIIVGASIARPLLAGGAIRLKAKIVDFAISRPVIMVVVVLFPAFRRADGQWPPLQYGELYSTMQLLIESASAKEIT